MICGQSEFAFKVCPKHGRIIRIQRDHHARLEKLRQRMFFYASHKSSAHITRKTDLESYLALAKQGEDAGIAGRGKPVADSFSAQHFHSRADARGSDGFARMGSEVQPEVASFAVDLDK